MVNVGTHIKRLRKEKTLSIRALAKQVNISHNTLASYERGKVMPSIENGFKIAQFFNVPIEYLVLGESFIADFNDAKLLELFKKVDSMQKEDKILIKNFIKKVIKNREERDYLNIEVRS